VADVGFKDGSSGQVHGLIPGKAASLVISQGRQNRYSSRGFYD
jgi:hypothetical protein